MTKVKLILLLLLCSGCGLFDKLDYPAEEYVQADRAFCSLISTPQVNFVGLIEGSTLTVLEKKAVLQAFSDWEYMIRKAEEATGMATLLKTP